MSETNGPSPQVQYLRALGHDEAADALLAADALIPASEQGEPVPDMQPRPVTERQPTAAEAEREAEGQAMLAALKRDIPDIFDR